MKYFLIGLLIVAAVAVAWGPIVSNVEQAKYSVVEKEGAFEIRDYAPMIVAEVDVTGNRQEAANNGFRKVAGYIFGANIKAEKVAMTAPVIQETSEKIAMTAPVLQDGQDGKWKVKFVMPSTYTLETLPAPEDPDVRLVAVEGKRYAVIRFSGLSSPDNLSKHSEKLMGFVSDRALKPLSDPVFAFFNPPWTLPFLRRNEVMIEITKP